jgi:hypothetical protein
VHDDLAHARSGFKTLDGHTVSPIWKGGDYLARHGAFRHSVAGRHAS